MMIWTKYLLTMAIVGAGLGVHAQYNETIRSGRPGQSIGPYTVGKRVLQFQAGHEFHKTFDLHAQTEEIRREVNNDALVVRYGVLEKVEAHFLLSHTRSRFTQNNSSFFQSTGFDQLGLAARVNIFDNPKGLIPALGIQTQALVPLSNQHNFGGRIVVITSRQLDQKFGLSSNYIFTNYFGNQAGKFDYVYTLSYQLTKRLGIIAEHFGSFTQNNAFLAGGEVKEVTWEKNYDVGMSFLLTKNLQLDAYGRLNPLSTFGINTYSSFINAGVSWRIRMKEKQKIEE